MTPLATVRELEIHLQRDLDDPEAAEQSLTLASGVVRAYCGWTVSLDTTTFFVSGDGSALLSLPTLNLISITQLAIGGTVIAPGASGYPTMSRKGQLWRGIGWPPHVDVQITCTHGFDPVPDLVKLVTLDVAARQLSNPEGLVSATTGPVTRTYASGSSGDPTKLSTLHSRLLDRWSL